MSNINTDSITNIRNSLMNLNLPPYNENFGYSGEIPNTSISLPIYEVTQNSSITPNIYNIYVPTNGYEEVNINTLNNVLSTNEPYFKFISSSYSPFRILVDQDPMGSNGNLSEDSNLAKINAESLRREFQFRITQETKKQTIYRNNLLDSNNDIFDLMAISTGNRAIIERDWRISVPNNLIDRNIDFKSRLSGLYAPYSFIPGDYFGKGRKVSLINTAVNAVTGLFDRRGILRLPPTKSMMEIFLENTGDGNKDMLFRTLSFNEYRPDYRTNLLTFLNPFLNPPKGNFYIGDRETTVDSLSMNTEQLPINKFGEFVEIRPSGDYVISEEYENLDSKFALSSDSYYATGNLLDGFTWVGSLTRENAGFLQGSGGVNIINNGKLRLVSFEKTESDIKPFRLGSVMDMTQRIIESSEMLNGSSRLKHAGHAINQVSKVFNDGLREITKGSKVKSYLDENGRIVGKEYCRVWTKDNPFMLASDLQKYDGITEKNRRFNGSVLDSTTNLNIVPNRGEDSTNIKEGKVKKYMFSLENLAWKNSSRKGRTYNELPAHEKGPNGGRIMWFPPYDIQISEQNSGNWNSNVFLGRPEPVYTYNNTERMGNLSFKIVVDHPSILNAIVDKELNSENSQRVNEIVDSFLAGCRKYDIYELATRFPQFSYSDIYEIIEKTENIELLEEVIREVPKERDIVDIENKYTPVITEDDYDIDFLFANDSPTPKNINITTSNIDYNQALASLLNTETTVEQVGGIASKNFLIEATKDITDKTSNLINKIVDAFDSGVKKIIITIEGTASSPSSVNYNKSLSKRRIDSVKQKILNNSNIIKYSDRIEWVEKAFGEEATVNILGTTLDCSEDLDGNDKYYSISAIGCRRVKITNIEEIEPEIEDNENEEEVEYVEESVVKTKIVERNTESLELRENIAKIVVKKLLTEGDYFNILKEEDPVIYDGIKEKFKYFHPAFHSTTPEGLNSRLTFLQQCLRPGDTIPVLDKNGNVRKDDTVNTAFGTPPICVLRIGDFYHSKIAINSMAINYEPLVYDMNPEGIGMQPMIANVSISFYFIGGQALNNPVERLQNALSFNFFANTEVYDDRSVETEDLTELNEEVLERINDNTPFNTKNSVNDPDNDFGATIGTTLSSSITELNGEETIEGQFSYKTIMEEYVSLVNEYNDTILDNLNYINDNYLIGGLTLLLTDRDYINGSTIGYFNNTNDKEIKILGKPKKIKDKITLLYDTCVGYVEDETSPLLEDYKDFNFKRRDRKKYVRNILNLFQIIYEDYNFRFNNFIFSTKTVQEKLISKIEKIDFILNDSDAYSLKTGKIVTFEITPTNEVNSNATDTKEELLDDIEQISDDLNNLYSNLENLNIIPNYNNKFNNNFNYNTFTNNTPQSVSLVTLIGGYFKNTDTTIILDILSEGLEGDFIDYIENKVILLKEEYSNSYNSSSQLLNSIDDTLSNYSPFNDKERVFDYIKLIDNDPIIEGYFSRLSSSSNTNNNLNKFNGKRIL